MGNGLGLSVIMDTGKFASYADFDFLWLYLGLPHSLKQTSGFAEHESGALLLERLELCRVTRGNPAQPFLPPTAGFAPAQLLTGSSHRLSEPPGHPREQKK